MSDIPNAAAVCPACRCCHPSVITVTCQLATHAAHCLCPPGNMWDIPNTAAACPAPKIKSKILAGQDNCTHIAMWSVHHIGNHSLMHSAALMCSLYLGTHPHRPSSLLLAFQLHCHLNNPVSFSTATSTIWWASPSCSGRCRRSLAVATRKASHHKSTCPGAFFLGI